MQRCQRHPFHFVPVKYFHSQCRNATKYYTKNRWYTLWLHVRSEAKKKKKQQKSHSADRNKPRPACRIYFRHACERKTDVVSGPATANCKQQTTTTTNIIINRIDELRKYLHIHTAHGVLVERNTRCTVHTHRHAFGNVDCCDGIYRWRV